MVIRLGVRSCTVQDLGLWAQGSELIIQDLGCRFKVWGLVFGVSGRSGCEAS